jgi:hypothetical protein
MLNLKCKRFRRENLYFFSRSSKRGPLLKDRTKVNFPVNESVLKQLHSDEDLPFKPCLLRAFGARNRVMI